VATTPPQSTLALALDGQTVDTLKGLYEHVTVRPRREWPQRKGELVAALVAAMQDPAALRALWGRLDRLSQAAVATTVHARGDALQTERIQARYGALPALRIQGARPYDAKPSALALFFYGGLMPADLKARLASFVPAPEPDAVASAEAPPEGAQVHEMEAAARHDLAAVLARIDAGGVSVGESTRLPSAASQRTIAAALRGGDFYDDEEVGAIRAFAWPLLVQAAGLAKGTRALALTDQGRKALREPPEQAIGRAWKAWQKSTLLDELSRIEAIKGRSSAGVGLTAIAGRRAAVTAALAACPVGRWVEIEEFTRYLRSAGHDFEVARNVWKLYFSSTQYGALGYGGEVVWSVLQGRYIRALLLEIAATLGLIDVALVHPRGALRDFRQCWGTDDLRFLSRYDGLRAIRLTPLGAWCLGQNERYVPASAPRREGLRVLPDLDIVVMGAELSPQDRWMLETWARPVSERVWKLDRAALLEAVEAGHALGEWRGFLEARSGEPLPEAARQILDDLADRASALRQADQALLIVVSSRLLALELAHDRRLKDLCWLAGEQILVVPLAQLKRFRAAVRGCGYVLPEGTASRPVAP